MRDPLRLIENIVKLLFIYKRYRVYKRMKRYRKIQLNKSKV